MSKNWYADRLRFLSTRRNRNHVNADSLRRQHDDQRLMVEQLEVRDLLTSVLYVDFGDNFPADGLDMTVGQLRGAIAGNVGIQGPDFREFAADNVTIVDYADTLGLRFTGTSPLVTFDYNGVGGVTGADYTDLRSNVLSLTQRYYNNIDCNVVIAPALDNSSDANYLQAIRDTLNLGAAVNGERDAWVFVSQIIRTDTNVSVGTDKSLNGQAAGADIGGNNARDDSAVTFADVVLGTQNATADTRLAYTVAHEAGHTFGQRHRNNGTSGTALDADMAQLTGSELVTESAGATNRTNFVFHTRYPLIRGDGNNNPPPATNAFSANDVENQYLQAAGNGRLGVRAGSADYVSGTGAHDQITITRTGATQAMVTIQAFRDAAYSSAITVPGTATTTFSYSIDTTNGILIEGGFGTDRITIDATISETITVRGMAGSADTLIINGGNLASGTYTPAGTQTPGLDGNTDFRGQIAFAGGATFNFEEFQTTGFVTVQSVTSFTIITPNSNDSVTMGIPAGGQNGVSGTSGGVAFVPLRFASVANFTIDTATNDGGSPNDLVTIASALVAAGMMNFTVNTGNGADELIINQPNYALPVGGGSFSFQGGADSDLITATANVSFNLSDSSLGIVSDSAIALTSVEQADLTGGASANTFTVSNWGGSAELYGQGASDSYIVNFVGSGSGSVLIFDSGASGTDTGEVNGTGGDNTLVITSTLVSLGSEDVTFSGLESLTVNGLAGDDIVNVRSTGASTPVIANGNDDDDIFNVGNLFDSLDDILGALTLNGNSPAASDSVFVNDQGDADAHIYVLTSSTVDRDGAALITYGTIELLTVNGGSGGNAINVQNTASTTSVVVNTGAGDDEVAVDSDGGPADPPSGTVDGIVSSLTINGQGGTNTLRLEDYSDLGLVSGDVVHVTPTQIGADPGDSFFGAGGSLAYSDLAHITLNLSNGYFPDTVYLIPSATTAFELHGNDPDCPMNPDQLPGDALYVDFTGVTDPLLLADGNGNATWTFSNREDVAFDGFEKLNHVGVIVVAPDVGSIGPVRVYDAELGTLKFTFLPYGSFSGGVRVAVGDVSCDGIPDIITAAGPGMAPLVRVFNGATGLPFAGTLGGFYAYAKGSQAGVWVAAGDINQDGFTDIITGPDNGGGAPIVKVFSGQTGIHQTNFLAYDKKFTGGVRVATGDINGDTVPDIIVAPGPGRAPLVRVFSGANLALAPFANFFAVAQNERKGVYVAAGDVNGDGRDDIITGGSNGSSRLVRVFNGMNLAAAPLFSFQPYIPDPGDSIRVAAIDINGDGDFEIVTAGGPGGQMKPKVYDFTPNPDEQEGYLTVTNTGSGGYYVGAGG